MTIAAHSEQDVQAAVVAHDALRVRGRGTKSPAGDAATLDVGGMRGVVEYSADECVFTALAGTPLTDIENLLARHRQYLPFDPPFAASGATIGGTIAAGVSGSLRYRYGGVRDFVIGTRIVDGEGRAIRSGGKVVKNAAGFLLHHAMVGSAGRFGVLTEVTVKVFPSPEARGTVTAACRTVDEAMRRVRALEAQRLDLEAIDVEVDGNLFARVAGRADALAARMEKLTGTIGGERVSASDDERIWREAREFAWVNDGMSIVKVPLSGSDLEAFARAVPTQMGHRNTSAKAVAARLRLTCGGRCAWIATPDVDGLSTQLASGGFRGVVIRGVDAGVRVGRRDDTTFEERVRRVLDPRNRFSAASNSR